MLCQTGGKRRMLHCFPSRNVKILLNRNYRTEVRWKRYGNFGSMVGEGKALTPISSATRRVTTYMLCSYSRLNWPLTDSNVACVRANLVIPFSIRVASVKMYTILVASKVIWFAIVPLLKMFLCRAAIKPIKFVISFPVQPNPSILDTASIPQQVVNKLVFILWFNHGQVCS
mgnify:CR=1 FL=1